MLIKNLRKGKEYLYDIGEGFEVKVKYKYETLNRYLFEEENGLEWELSYVSVKLYINEIA